MPLIARTTAMAPWLAVFACALSAPAQPPPATVRVVAIVERDLPSTIRLVGTVMAEREAIIAAEVAGVVAEYTAGEGQYLEAGEPLCRLDSALVELKLAEETSRLGGLRAELTERENGTRKEVLAQLKASVGEAEAMYNMWKFERERVGDLFSRNQSSAKEKHDTEMEYLAAERRFAQTTAALEAAVNGPRAEEIDRYKHMVAAQTQIVRQLEREFEKITVRAPFPGFVVAKRTEVGEWIAIGDPVAEMVAIDTVKVRADAPESAIPFARPETPAGVEIESLGQTRAGVISRAIPRANQSARTFPVEIDLENANHDLLPGMFVWALVPAGPSGKRLMVPKDAVVPRGIEKHVFVIRLGEGGARMAIPMLVETGLEIDDDIEIRAEGLQAGDQVVTRANERLLPFMPNAVIVPGSATPATQGDVGASDGPPPGDHGADPTDRSATPQE
jgi:multidrug efflux pump subunit AcrA (membrane-fusion protein)